MGVLASYLNCVVRLLCMFLFAILSRRLHYELVFGALSGTSASSVWEGQIRKTGQSEIVAFIRKEGKYNKLREGLAPVNLTCDYIFCLLATHIYSDTGLHRHDHNV